ncbi:MAG: hypothetical protein NVSMB64_04740 [Candidatus Velthaea sp.]
MPIRVSSKNLPASPTKQPSSGLPFGLPQSSAGTEQMPEGVSLCMIVRNEERFLRACLESVHGLVDEICIVDTGSTDGTIAIAQEFGARIERRAWRNDFAWARNEALDMATRRWILVLDADEVVRPESHDALRLLRTASAALTGMWVRCFNIVDDYKGTGASSHMIARIFPNSARIRYRSPIHEYITLDQCETGIEAANGPVAIDHYGYLKSVVAERNKADRNLEIIRAAVAAHPDDPFHWYNLGTTALIEKHADEGISALEKMREIVGDTARGFVPSGLSFLADAYLEYRGDAQRCVELARLSVQRSPNFANAHFTQGKGLSALGRFAESIAAYKAAIEAGKFNDVQFLVDNEVSTWKAHSEIGAAYGRAGDKIEALRWFDAGLKNRPGVLPLMLNRARALESLERFGQAHEQFRACWEQFADDQTGTDYINFLLRRHDYSAALATIDEAAGRVSTHCSALLLMTAAGIADRVARSADGPGYARRALALAPGSGPVLDAAEVYFREKGDSDAIAALRAAELEAPLETVEDYGRRSSRWLEEGQPARAREVALEGRRRFGDHPGLLYDAGAATVQLGDRNEAVALLAAVSVQHTETFAKAAFLRSVILTDLGRHGEALGAIETVLYLSPHSVEAVLQRVKILFVLGRTDDAEASLRAALSATRDARIAVELAGFLMSAGRFVDARDVAESALVAG